MHYVLALLLAISAAAVIATGAVGTLAQEEAAAPSPAPTKSTEKSAEKPTEKPAKRDETCLSPADMREAVAEKRVIAPIAAIRAARQANPRAEIQRASLCKHEDGLVYVLTTLRRDGQFLQVTVDAQSGQVQEK